MSDLRAAQGLRTGRRSGGHGFGTAPVFLAAISTILGAILFLRFGYAVGHTGLGGALLIVLIGHAITIPTGLAVAEIATNLKVAGGGEYFIISRSFGATVGGAIGLSLYLSQAISVAFYLIAFAEAFRPLSGWLLAETGVRLDVRMIAVPATLLLAGLILRRGASLGVSALGFVAALLAVSLGSFFLGGRTPAAPAEVPLFARVDAPDGFFHVFAIVFPAFTGMTAGVGLSGDLRRPHRSIPLGTLSATLTGMVVYMLVVVRLAAGASPAEMGADPFIMMRLSLWGPLVLIGLAAATLSSAIGSILVAPRTLQALAGDGILPVESWNRVLRQGRGPAREPVNATLLTTAIALCFVAIGSVNVVAQVISMFFMITYGALCSVSFLEHFAGNPSYRPTFRTKWYLSLIGAVASILMMFLMQPLYAALAVAAMVLIYGSLNRSRRGERDLAVMLKGVLYQTTRQLQVLIQKYRGPQDLTNWRPSFVAVSARSLERLAPFDLLRWISHHRGFGTYIHYLRGPLAVSTHREAGRVLERLIDQARASEAGIYVDTLIAPSFKTAVAQIVQLPGVAGMENNSILFDFSSDEPEDLPDLIDGSLFAAVVGYNVCILRSSPRHFGYRRVIHIWLTAGDYRNANLMILLAYILSGHPEWRRAEITLFAAVGREDAAAETERLTELIRQGRIPISPANVRQVSLEEGIGFEQLMAIHSGAADLVVTGLSLKKMRRDGGRFLRGFAGVQDMLFVRAGQEILITSGEAEFDPDASESAESEPRPTLESAERDSHTTGEQASPPSAGA